MEIEYIMKKNRGILNNTAAATALGSLVAALPCAAGGFFLKEINS